MRVLAGDVGGTTTRLAVYEVADGRLEHIAESRYASREHSGLAEIVADFLGSEGTPTSASFGVAGPVRDGVARITNLPWVIDAAALAGESGIARVRLMNDVEAAARGIEALADEDVVELAAGEGEPEGNRALMALGTGLGQAGLHWDGERYRPFACEGGHADFAPSSELEIELLRRLRQRYGHVSWERAVSGGGLVDLHRFLADLRGAETPRVLAEALDGDDPAAAITEAARSGRHPVCREALDLFVRLCGAEAGNLALKLGATGGVYIGGGVAAKLRPELESPELLEAFRDKGRMRPLLERVPLRLILDEGIGLRGAALGAAGDG